ncbi:MAG: acetylornithine/succinylornithine family transaminase [Ruminococcaceae bacterium]|nr:acetylornithine/succinylornithine family transaminase [Oscillospiraceae bacterium]
MDIKQLDQEYIVPTYARFPICLKEGKGSCVTDDTGKTYIDLGTGIAVNGFGVADEEWIAAVTEQLGKIQHTSNLYYNEPCAKLAEQLCLRTGMKKVFFSNSGAEANECAIKTARKYGELHKGAEYTTIITLKDGFHGRTITTLAATGQEVFHKDFLPLTDGFVYAEANNLADVERLASEFPCCAVMFEVVQGEGGVRPLSAEFLSGLEKLAHQKELLLIADEVQTGNGRTGKLYGYMNYGIQPDIVTTAKGLGGGLPIGATMLGEKVSTVLGAGMHGSTFGGNPVCCAGALNILSRIDEVLLAGVQMRSNYIFDTLTNAPGIKSVTGLGLMIGIECEKPAAEVIDACRERGVLVIKAKHKVRLLPALNIKMEELKQAIEIIKEACAV